MLEYYVPEYFAPEIEIMRARELALASRDTNQLFWIVIVGALVIIAFWSVVRWRIRRHAARARRALLRLETERHCAANPRYDEIAWNEFCDRNDLPMSTRNVVMAQARHGGYVPDI